MLNSEKIANFKRLAVVSLVLMHVGLLLSVISLARAESVSPLMIAGTATMYGAFLLAVLSIWLPIRPWLERYRRLQDWRGWILNELPTILALVPVLISAIQVLKEAWRELKLAQEAGSGIDAETLSKAALKIVVGAEKLARSAAAADKRET